MAHSIIKDYNDSAVDKTTVSCCLKDLLNIVKGVIIKEYLWTAALLTVALSKVLILLLSC